MLLPKDFDSQGTAAFVIAGAARTAAGTLIVDLWNDCCLKRVGSRGGLADKADFTRGTKSQWLRV